MAFRPNFILMMNNVALWMRKREMGDEDENDVEDTSRYEKSGVQDASLDWEDLVLVLLHVRS